MRILKAVGAKPRRTIRVAIWGDEEQGLLGSKAWVAQHLVGDDNRQERENFAVYFNIDNGTGPIYGFATENNEGAKPLFDAWLAQFRDIGARRNVNMKITSTDHMSFIAAGVPGFNPFQIYETYDVRTHHTNNGYKRPRESRRHPPGGNSDGVIRLAKRDTGRSLAPQNSGNLRKIQKGQAAAHRELPPLFLRGLNSAANEDFEKVVDGYAVIQDSVGCWRAWPIQRSRRLRWECSAEGTDHRALAPWSAMSCV